MKNREINRENINKKPGISSSNSTGSPNSKEYNSIPSDRFYTEKEEVTLRFYQTPKALFKNPKYKGLSLGPKLMYSILRDRLDLSIKNNWKDENGFIYLVFSIEELSTLLEINRETVTTYKRKLVKYRLIIDKRLGQGKSNNLNYPKTHKIVEFINSDKKLLDLLKEYIDEIKILDAFYIPTRYPDGIPIPRSPEVRVEDFLWAVVVQAVAGNEINS